MGCGYTESFVHWDDFCHPPSFEIIVRHEMRLNGKEIASTIKSVFSLDIYELITEFPRRFVEAVIMADTVGGDSAFANPYALWLHAQKSEHPKKSNSLAAETATFLCTSSGPYCHKTNLVKLTSPQTMKWKLKISKFIEVSQFGPMHLMNV